MFHAPSMDLQLVCILSHQKTKTPLLSTSRGGLGRVEGQRRVGRVRGRVGGWLRRRKSQGLGRKGRRKEVQERGVGKTGKGSRPTISHLHQNLF